MLLLNATLAWMGALSISPALQTCLSRLALGSTTALRPVLLLAPADARLLPGTLAVLQSDPRDAQGRKMIQQLTPARSSQVAVAWLASEGDLKLVTSQLSSLWRHGQLVLILEPSLSPAVTYRALALTKLTCVTIVQADMSTKCPSPCSPTDLSGSTMRIDAFTFPPMMFLRSDWKKTGVNAISGLYGNFYPILSKFGNFTAKIYVNKLGLSKCVKKPKGGVQISSSKDDLVNDYVDLSAGPVIISLQFHREMEFTTCFYSGCVSWFVPRALPVSPLLNLVLPLQPSAWLAVLAALVLAWVVALVSGRLAVSQAGLHALSTLLGSSMPTPTTMSRLALTGLRLGCIVLTVAYQSKLASILTVPTFEPELDTSEQIINSGHHIGMLCLIHTVFSGSDDETDPIQKLIPVIETIEKMTDGITRVALKRDMVFLAAKLPGMYVMSKVLDHPAELVHIQSGCELVSPVGLLLRRGDPRLARISELVSWVNQAGLIYKWEAEVLAGMHVAPQLVPRLSPVTIRHLAGAFATLALGLTAAGLSCGCELLTARLLRPRQRKK